MPQPLATCTENFVNWGHVGFLGEICALISLLLIHQILREGGGAPLMPTVVRDSLGMFVTVEHCVGLL